MQAKYKKEHGSEPKYERIPHWDRSLLALQGPAAHEALRTLVPSSFNLDKFYFGQFATTSLKGIPAWVTRVGWVPRLLNLWGTLQAQQQLLRAASASDSSWWAA